MEIDPAWLASGTLHLRELWRGVEAQHPVATMKLVDSVQEQQLLEQLLEGSKPPLPPSPADAGRHSLLYTPFRYICAWPSRFHRPELPGAWYGADEPATVAAEVGVIVLSVQIDTVREKLPLQINHLPMASISSQCPLRAD